VKLATWSDTLSNISIKYIFTKSPEVNTFFSFAQNLESVCHFTSFTTKTLLGHKSLVAPSIVLSPSGTRQYQVWNTLPVFKNISNMLLLWIVGHLSFRSLKYAFKDVVARMKQYPKVGDIVVVALVAVYVFLFHSLPGKPKTSMIPCGLCKECMDLKIYSTLSMCNWLYPKVDA
jgi:hypothetical protein